MSFALRRVPVWMTNDVLALPARLLLGPSTRRARAPGARPGQASAGCLCARAQGQTWPCARQGARSPELELRAHAAPLGHMGLPEPPEGSMEPRACTHMCLDKCLHMHVCTCLHMHVCTRLHTHVCTHLRMHVCVHVRVQLSRDAQ